MNFMQRRSMDLMRSLFLALAALAIGATASAQPQSGDPPGRVARLSDLNGQVWLYSPESGDWINAVRNQPLTTGDRLATDPGARAELQVGSTTLRLDSGTELEVLDLDDDRLELQLHNGSVAARVRDLAGAGQVEISTDAGRFVVQRAGSYRFDHDERASHATVYSGRARYEGPNSALPVNAGQRAEFWIDAAGAAQYSVSSPVNDDFTAWNRDRDRRPTASAAARYASPEMTGVAELDRYGRWEQSPDYGSLWIPTSVAAGWAPYSEGHWAWVRPWGWTWIDDAPWGFAPFHYGRWVNVRNTWGWTPGVRVSRPVYAPALVAWVGGPRVDVSISIGGGGPAVGWFPLAPREVYVPSYQVSPRYVQNINITHVTNVAQITTVINNPQRPREFENRRFPSAITVVPAGVMTERRPVAPAAAQLRQAPWVRELAREPGRMTALMAPPVTAPVLSPRGAEPRAIRPPPGADLGGGERRAFGRPGFAPRERSDDERRAGPREAERREFPGRGQAAQLPAQTPAQPAPAKPAAAPLMPPRSALPEMVPIVPVQPASDRAERRHDGRPGTPGRGQMQRDNVERAPAAAPPQAVAPVSPPQLAVPAAPAARPAVAPAPQEAPTMRALPVQRAQERRDERRGDDRRGDERRVQPRPEATLPADGPQAPRVERQATPASPRPVQPPPAARPVEVQRAAPAAPSVAPGPDARKPDGPQQWRDPRDPRDRER